MPHEVLGLVAVVILGYALVSGRLQTSVVTPPMAFVTVGLIMGPAVLGLIEVEITDAVIATLAELTLVLVLFTDAARISFGALRHDFHLPARLLGIGLPLTILLGTLIGTRLLPGLTVWEVALVAVVLAPTDAALGQPTVSDPRVPVRIRQALNVESGLNDGIALPLVLMAIALAGDTSAAAGMDDWVVFIAIQLALGVTLGSAVGYVGGRLVDAATTARWMTTTYQQLSALSLAVLAFGLAETLGGNGFIAAFVAGLAVGNTTRGVCDSLCEFAEAEGQLLALLIFMILGGVVAWPMLRDVDLRILLYGALSLTAVRVLAVAVSLVGSGLRADTILFLGWFGPRGLASIVFAVLILGSPVGPRAETFMIVVATVLMSVFAHGLTAGPGARWYGARSDPANHRADAPELVPVTELPLRIPGPRD